MYIKVFCGNDALFDYAMSHVIAIPARKENL